MRGGALERPHKQKTRTTRPIWVNASLLLPRANIPLKEEFTDQVKRNLPSRRLTYQQEKRSNFTIKKGKPSNRRQTIWSRLLEFPWLWRENQGKRPKRQTKKHPVDIIRILNFRTGPKGRKISRFKSNFEGKPWNQHASGPQIFWYRNQKRTRRPEESEQPFFYKTA